MPKAKSKAQQKWFFAAERRGELKKGTAQKHAKKGKAYKKLPGHVRKKGGRKK